MYEIIPIVLGVLIALFLNNWKENYDDKRYLGHIEDSIAKEVRENKKSISSVLIKQQALLDTLERYLDVDSISLLVIVTKNNGFQMSTIRNASLKALMNAKIELIDLQTIANLTEIDELKQTLSIKMSKLMDYIYANLRSTKREDKELFSIHIMNVIDSEEQLLELLDEFMNPG